MPPKRKAVKLEATAPPAKKNRSNAPSAPVSAKSEGTAPPAAKPKSQPAANGLKTEFSTSAPKSKSKPTRNTTTAAATTNAQPKHSQKKPGHPNPLARKYGHHLRKPKTEEEEEEESLTVIRKKLRDTERQLRKATDMPATTQQDLRRRVKALKLKIERKVRDEKEKKLQEKYKYVRFIERKKCVRKLAQAERALKAVTPNTPEYTKLSEEHHRAKVNLKYTERFPMDMKYISLFPDGNHAHEYQRTIWDMISEKVKNGEEKFILRKKDVERWKNGGGQSEKSQKNDGEEREEDGEREIKEEQEDDFFMGADEENGKAQGSALTDSSESDGDEGEDEEGVDQDGSSKESEGEDEGSDEDDSGDE